MRHKRSLVQKTLRRKFSFLKYAYVKIVHLLTKQHKLIENNELINSYNEGIINDFRELAQTQDEKIIKLLRLLSSYETQLAQYQVTTA